MKPRRAKLDIQVADIQCVVFDEFAPRFDLVAHQHGADFVGFDSVVDADLQQGARFRIHGGFPQLFGINFTQAFVTLNRQVLLRGCEHTIELLVLAIAVAALAVFR